MKSILIGLIAALTVGFSGAATAQQGDARIQAARDALRHGDRGKLERLSAAREDHLLGHYVEYWLLIDQLSDSDPAPHGRVRAFIERHAGSVPAERLRSYWLRRLAEDSDWPTFLQVYKEHERPDARLRCQAWRARYQGGEREVLNEIADAWRHLLDSPSECDMVLQAAVVSGPVGEDEFWWRFRRQIDSRAPRPARVTFSWADGSDAHRGAVADLLQSPGRYLARLPDDFDSTRAGRELALAALVRYTRHEDAGKAHARFVRIKDRLPEDKQRYMYAVLGHHGALSRLPEAIDWYREAGRIEMTAAQRSWRVRAALRAEDWLQVERGIRLLEPDEQRQAEWVYWRARAHAAQGRGQEAEQLYQSIVGEPTYYSMLAAEELGRLFEPPEGNQSIAPADRARVETDPGLQRALTFYRLGMPTEGVREWLRAVRGRERGFLLAAAHLAREHDIHDRAINTAEMADANANFELRFLTPFLDVIGPHAVRQQLKLAWIYGLMRQESRFVVPARSQAGARGLMQVMPATGEWVAQRLGVRGYTPRMLDDPDTNVMLGTGYMRIILEELDGHPVLASAGYNAGPRRAQRWRSDAPIDGDIYTATIPIDETRDYVEKVMANKVIYAAMMEGRQQSLKARLGTIYPRAEQ